MLGHDLRNPLASIASGTKLLLRGNREPAPILALMQQSVARMSALIDNVLDFARGRLGGGVTLNRTTQPLEPVLDQVIAELRASYPASRIETHFDLMQQVDCDGGRIAQLFSNLLGNALTHGTPGSPVRVRAAMKAASSNCRSPISATRSRRKRSTGCSTRSTGSAGRAAGPRIGALHRLRNRPRPWRKNRGRLLSAGDPVHVPDAASMR